MFWNVFFFKIYFCINFVLVYYSNIYIYMYIYTSVHAYLYISLHMYIYIYIYLYIYIDIRMHLHDWHHQVLIHRTSLPGVGGLDQWWESHVPWWSIRKDRFTAEMASRKIKMFQKAYINMGVSKNRGTPKSSILIGCSLNKPSILGYPYFWKHPYSSGQISSRPHTAANVRKGNGTSYSSEI